MKSLFEIGTTLNDKNKNCIVFTIYYLFIWIFIYTCHSILDVNSKTLQTTIGETDQTLMIRQSVIRNLAGNQ